MNKEINPEIVADNAEEQIKAVEEQIEAAEDKIEAAEDLMGTGDVAAEELMNAAEKELDAAEDQLDTIKGASEEKVEALDDKIDAAEDRMEDVEKKAKPKKSKAGKVILTIFIVLLALVLIAAIAVGALGFSLFNKATAEIDLPVEQKVSASDMTLFVAEACVELLSDDQIVINNNEMQALIDKVKPAVESSLAGTPVVLKDLFCVFAEDKGTIYGQVYISELEVSGIKLPINKDVTVKAEFDVRFEAPYIVAQIKEVYCGELAIPVSLVTQFTSGIQLPSGLKLEGDEIYYDVSGLDSMIDEMLPSVMSESLGEGFLASALSDLLVESTDVEITGADIIDNELVIDGHIF